jgi:hypothetical protein
MFPRADRKWKVQQGYELGSNMQKKDEATKVSKKNSTPYLEAAKEELNNFVAADDALRKLVKQTSFDKKVGNALGHATDTLVKALVQEAEKRKYEYVTSVEESDSTEASKKPELAEVEIVSASTHIQVESGCTEVAEGTTDNSASTDTGSAKVDAEDTSVELDAVSPGSPVLVWNHSPNKKKKSFDGYNVRVETKKDPRPHTYSDYNSLVREVELNRVVEVEPTLPSDIKIVKRNGINLIIPTASQVPPNTDTITVTASDLQKCGNDLGMLRACMVKKSHEPGNIINITLHKRYGEKLGVSVEFEDLQISSFHEGGLFCMWNESNPDQRVHVGSRILEANGKSEIAEKLKELKDATYATAIDLKIECAESEPEELVEIREEEEFVPYDPWANMPVIPCQTQNESHINQEWFPPSPEVSDEEESAPRRPCDKSRSGSCPPDPFRRGQRKPSLPPVNKPSRTNSRPSSQSSSAKDSRNGRSTSNSRDCASSASSSRQASSERRTSSSARGGNIPRGTPSSRPLSGCSSVEKLPPIP